MQSLERLLRSETCRKANLHNSAIAATGLLLAAGPQSGGLLTAAALSSRASVSAATARTLSPRGGQQETVVRRLLFASQFVPNSVDK